MIFHLGQHQFNNRQELLSELNQKIVLACDTESSPAELLGVALAWSATEAVFFTPDEPDLPAILQSRELLFHNALYDLPLLHDMLLHYNISSPQLRCTFDTMLASQSLGYHPALGDLSVPFNFSHRHVTDLLYDKSGIKMKIKEEGKRKRDLNLGDMPIEDVAKICCEHARATFKVWEKLKDKVPQSYHLDFSLIPLIMRMHKHGIRVDSKLAQERSKVLDGEIGYIRGLCEGMGFNPASPKQIGMALAHQNIFTYIPRGSNQMTTDEDSLLPYKDDTPIVPLVLKFRAQSYLNSHYVKPLVTISRWYPRYHIVRTGRFASSPQIQNIPENQRDLYLPDEGDYFLDFDACLDEDTLVQTPLNREGVAIKNLKSGDLVFSWDGGACLDEVVAVGRTKHRRETYKLTLSNGETIIASGNHRLIISRPICLRDRIPYRRLRDGYSVSWMKKGQTFYPFNRHIIHGREAIGRSYIAKMFKDYFGWVGIVHHKDGNPLNWNPDNLESKTQSEHAKHHYWKRIHTDGKEMVDYQKISSSSRTKREEPVYLVSKEYIGRRYLYDLQTKRTGLFGLMAGVISHNSQVEPVIMAHLSGDKKLLEDVLTGDVYVPIARRYNIKRYTSKQLFLAGAYGSGAETLVETAQGHDDILTIPEAQAILRQFKADYPRLVEWGFEERKKAANVGYTTTMLGRKRTLESMSENEEPGYDPLLKVVNTKVQGTASEILKLAMKRVEEEKVRATIHDEILISVQENRDISKDIGKKLTKLCVIPVKWTAKKGQDWLHLVPTL